ncbi:hypothetical protein [Tabrizicola soli]|uniref:Uncharacterized protein n=1 Tax=Tabrizicola soli TaxID=2185115 RepID=A0ABV7DQ26_9RHOB|nr:hypothetical protein [Tabrizicola soli]
MTPLAIPAHERHGIRVFAAALSPEEMQRDKAGLVAALFGDPDLDPAHVELFDTADLAGVGLAGYLAEGLGVSDAALAPDRARLEAVRGPVLILHSRALHGRAVTLIPDPRLTLLAGYTEERPPVHFEPLPSDAAKGSLTAPGPSAPAPRLPRRALALGAALLLAGLAALVLAWR